MSICDEGDEEFGEFEEDKEFDEDFERRSRKQAPDQPPLRDV
ncbi:MAG TPA: hypothetical protein VGQ29_11960 [Gemmatimonadales bacterium]|nr:hypothetical protein [Gemmatimonadales bacterium]